MKGALVALFLITFATVAYAETLPHGLQKTLCKPGGVMKDSPSIFSAEAGASEMKKLTGSSNFCTNETVSLQVGIGGGVLTDKSMCICTSKAQFDKVGCGPGQTQPTVTTVIATSYSGCTRESITISKCVADPDAAYAAACKNGADMSHVAPNADTPPAPIPVVATSPDLTTVTPTPAATGSTAITQALVASGVPEDKAKDIVAKDPLAASQYINAFVGGDQEAIKAAAAKLDINPNLSADVSQMQAVKAAAQQAAEDPAAGIRDNYSSQSTFTSNPPQTPNGESIQSADGKVLTLYVPHDAPGCASSLEGCIATSRPNLTDGSLTPMTLDCVRHGQCQFVSLASDPSNYGKFYNVGTVTYTSAEDGKSYTLQNVVGYVHDTGGAFIGHPDKLDIAATVCSGCSASQASAIAAGGITAANVSNVPTQPSSPFSVFGNQSAFVGNTSGSPFANVNPVAPSQYTQQTAYAPQQVAYQTAQQPLYQYPVQQPQPVVPIPVLPVQPVYSPAKPTATLIVQPQTVALGTGVSVAWSSVGMSTSSPCIVSKDGTQVGSGNEGSQRIIVRSAGTFMLTCIGNGVIVTHTADVFLK